MARLPRLVMPGQPHHIIQRGTDRQPVFRSPDDYRRMLDLLAEHSARLGIAIHAYVLMSNHFHLLATPSTSEGLSVLMQSVGRHYVRYFNDRHKRTGTLWEGRFKATIIDSERYLFTCMAYIDLNPVRAGIVGEPSQYEWSSYAHNAGIRADPLIKEHALFWALGNTPFAREAAYREIVAGGISHADQSTITQATLRGWVLAPPDSPVMSGEMSRRPAPLPRGRPRKLICPH